MDTIEQLNGTYFFNGMFGLDKHELLFWILLDEADKQFGGALDIFAFSSMLLSFPVIPVRGKLDAGKTTKGTSPLSYGLRMLIKQRFRVARRTLTFQSIINGRWAYTTNVAAYMGRWIPWLGALITAYDASVITVKTVNRYKLITGATNE